MADKQLNKAEQQLAKANQQANEATKLSQDANEQIFVAIAHAERVEQLAVDRIQEAEERVNLQAETVAKCSKSLAGKLMNNFWQPSLVPRRQNSNQQRKLGRQRKGFRKPWKVQHSWSGSSWMQ